MMGQRGQVEYGNTEFESRSDHRQDLISVVPNSTHWLRL